MSQNFLYQHTTQTNVGYFDEAPAKDLREGKDFQILKEKVLSHLSKTQSQTWRQLVKKFPDRYRLTLAVKALVTDRVVFVDDSKPIEKIVFVGKK